MSHLYPSAGFGRKLVILLLGTRPLGTPSLDDDLEKRTKGVEDIVVKAAFAAATTRGRIHGQEILRTIYFAQVLCLSGESVRIPGILGLYWVFLNTHNSFTLCQQKHGLMLGGEQQHH